MKIANINMHYGRFCDSTVNGKLVFYGLVNIPDINIGLILASYDGDWHWVEDQALDPLVTQFLESLTKSEYSAFFAEIKRQNFEYISNRGRFKY